MNSVNRFVPDAAYAIRKASDAAITAATTISAGELVSPIGAPWNDTVKDGKVVVFFGASALDKTTGDETYKLDIVTSANADLSGGVVSLSKAITANGWYDILVDQVALLKENPLAKYWGLVITPAGTSPTVKIEAYILPPVGN